MEHLEGKNHKKKEAMAKNAAAHGGSTAEAARINKHFHCELCDVVCTCSDTFTAHLRGTKHNKVDYRLVTNFCCEPCYMPSLHSQYYSCLWALRFVLFINEELGASSASVELGLSAQNQLKMRSVVINVPL